MISESLIRRQLGAGVLTDVACDCERRCHLLIVHVYMERTMTMRPSELGERHPIFSPSLVAAAECVWTHKLSFLARNLTPPISEIRLPTPPTSRPIRRC